jgi:uncharacterized repeat protein (TIGR03803 family)
LALCAAAMSAPAQTFTTLASFNGTNGRSPVAALAQGTDGNFYGTTADGGSSTACGGSPCGTVFRVTRTGTITTLYSFDIAHGADPSASLVLGTDGNFYGTTTEGGINGDGTVFRISPQGELKTLHSFSYYVDGGYPSDALVQGSDGNFYGTTSQGGANLDGTIFRITPEGKLDTLHGFDGSDGCDPVGGLVQGSDGSFYGTTTGASCGADNGTIFKLSLDGVLATVFSFDYTDGFYPASALIQAPNGSFYGTTYEGGTNEEGTVFSVTSGGIFATLYNFCTESDCTDGEAPFAGLAQGTDGNFYGTTTFGGANNSSLCSNLNVGCGTIFKIAPTGTLNTLYSFCAETNCSDGLVPIGGLVQGTDARFYGTTRGGGADGDGTVYALYLGLHPFVETVPLTGAVGTSVMILGTDLTGATSVTFNGTPAAFTVVSSTEITTTVPTGAITGKVEVVTPSETLSSNVKFRVRP